MLLKKKKNARNLPLLKPNCHGDAQRICHWRTASSHSVAPWWKKHFKKSLQITTHVHMQKYECRANRASEFKVQCWWVFIKEEEFINCFKASWKVKGEKDEKGYIWGKKAKRFSKQLENRKEEEGVIKDNY